MIRVLFVDDDSASVEPPKRALERLGYSCDIAKFDEADAFLADKTPDVVVLDIIEGALTGDPLTPGKGVYDMIWSEHFCPLIIYSADPALITDTHPPHPFVKSVTKGSQSVGELEAAIQAFRPQIEALGAAKSEIAASLADALRDIAQPVFDAFESDDARVQAVIRSGRRRVAALMDQSLNHDGSDMASWEQYLFPPVGEDLILGDILQVIGGDGRPCEFRLVLTPSCDLARHGDPPRAKTPHVLVAKCTDLSALKDHPDLRDESEGVWRSKVRGVLTQGFHRHMLPLPALGDVVPGMVANLRKLELLPMNDVLGDEPKYKRVVSMDSPFREVVSWAYLQIACRPGLPDRDWDTWCDEIMGPATEVQVEGDDESN